LDSLTVKAEAGEELKKADDEDEPTAMVHDRSASSKSVERTPKPFFSDALAGDRLEHGVACRAGGGHGENVQRRRIWRVWVANS
jgi:hypothetical protein